MLIKLNISLVNAKERITLLLSSLSSGTWVDECCHKCRIVTVVMASLKSEYHQDQRITLLLMRFLHASPHVLLWKFPHTQLLKLPCSFFIKPLHISFNPSLVLFSSVFTYIISINSWAFLLIFLNAWFLWIFHWITITHK